jgi:hypothetical protein
MVKLASTSFFIPILLDGRDLFVSPAALPQLLLHEHRRSLLRARHTCHLSQRARYAQATFAYVKPVRRKDRFEAASWRFGDINRR